MELCLSLSNMDAQDVQDYGFSWLCGGECTAGSVSMTVSTSVEAISRHSAFVCGYAVPTGWRSLSIVHCQLSTAGLLAHLVAFAIVDVEETFA